ncbi:MAG: hypothetical protein ACK59A_11865 [Cyanobacteriota bacterium]|jgi:hypothetical protein
MPESITWSLAASGTPGPTIQATGKTPGDGFISISLEVEKSSGPTDHNLQVDNVDKVNFLLISSDLLDGKISVKADRTDATPLTGPLLLVGAAVKLFANNLTTLTVTNSSTEKKATLFVLIGLTL